jgi:hypothetical protein
VLTGLWTGPCGVRPVNVAEKGAASVLYRTLAHGGDRTRWLYVWSRMTYGDARRRSWLERIKLWTGPVKILPLWMLTRSDRTRLTGASSHLFSVSG